jgi:hypothetical protein
MGHGRTIRSIGLQILLAALTVQGLTPDQYDLASDRLLKLCEASLNPARSSELGVPGEPVSFPQEEPEDEDAPDESCPPAGISLVSRAVRAIIASLVPSRSADAAAAFSLPSSSIRQSLRAGLSASARQHLHILCRLTC